MARKKEETPPVVRVAPLGELKAYTVSEHELDRLARGSVVSDLLTIAYALLSVAVTLLATLLSTTLDDLRLTHFFCAFLIFTIAGVICFIIGWRTRESVKSLVNEIKNRMPPPAERIEVTVRPVSHGGEEKEDSPKPLPPP
jgi:hypothetical protein